MSIMRREVLAAAVFCGLASTALADEKPSAQSPAHRDPVLSFVPSAARKVFEDTFPRYRCIRLVTQGEDEAAVYRATFFDPANWSGASGGLIDGEHVVTPPLYHLELDAAGKVIEESQRPVKPEQLPKAVSAAYEKWNPKGVTAQEH